MGEYSTNDICQLCNISRKQLRYYEESGLLGAVPRNEENNYRYYTAEHIYKIAATRGLKNIEMSTGEMKAVIHGESIDSVQDALQLHLEKSREALEASVRRFEQSTIFYSKLMEALSLRKIYQQTPFGFHYEFVNHKQQNVVAMEYETTWEDYECMDVHHIPTIQTIAQNVNAAYFGALTYMTYDHFDSSQNVFNDHVNRFKIAIPVADLDKPCSYYDVIPAFRGVSAIHVGSPKNGRLTDTYMGLLNWAKQQELVLENWSVEEWVISPIVTNNKDLWVIKILIPIKQ